MPIAQAGIPPKDVRLVARIQVGNETKVKAVGYNAARHCATCNGSNHAVLQQ